MKTKIIVWVSLLLTLNFASCEYDDTELWNKLNNQEERLAALEKWQEATNNNITALQELISTTDHITSVSPILQGKDTIGYSIAFQNSDPISIYHGTTSQIGVSQGEDGNWYWTIDGEILKDSLGNPIFANGKDAPAPQMSTGQQLKDKQITTDAEGHAIVTDAVYLSVDEGKTWYRVSGKKGDTGDTGATGPTGPTGSSGDSFFQNVTIKDDHVLFTLKDGSTFKVPKYKGSITFLLGGTELTDLTQTIDISAGDLTYVATENGTVSVRILEGSDWNAEVIDTKINITGVIGTSALLEVTLMDNGKVIEIYRLQLSLLSGKGTEDEPYMISSAGNLRYVAKQVNGGTSYKGKFFQLAQDIDLNNVEWTPIGKSGVPFEGTFDGCGHIISNLFINTPSHYMGLFGYTANGKITNFTLHNAFVNGKGKQEVGAIAGSPYTSSYSNITLTGNVKVEGLAYVGGMFGKNVYKSMENLTVRVESGSYVKAESGIYRTYVGGVIGFMGEGNITISNVKSNIDVTGSTCDVGGITGIAHYGNTFENCICTGNATLVNANDAGDQLEIGGIAGVWMNSMNGKVTLRKCNFTGTLKSALNGVDKSEEVAGNLLTGRKYYPNSNEGELIIE